MSRADPTVLRQAARRMRLEGDDSWLVPLADYLDACAAVLDVSATAVRAHARNIAQAYLQATTNEKEEDHSER